MGGGGHHHVIKAIGGPGALEIRGIQAIAENSRWDELFPIIINLAEGCGEHPYRNKIVGLVKVHSEGRGIIVLDRVGIEERSGGGGSSGS